MTMAILVRGHLVSPTQVQLDEPISGTNTDVEVLVRPLAQANEIAEGPWSDYIAHLPAGTRTVADINAQISEERDTWGCR